MGPSALGIRYELGYCLECEAFGSYAAKVHDPIIDGREEFLEEQLNCCSRCGSDSIDAVHLDLSEEDVTQRHPPQAEGPPCPNCGQGPVIVEWAGEWD